ncbi:hypothetical protein [Pseudoxanthomonas composti]|uniref:Uncharacterized protein n=1 Tax=Pseudoxanthomonas composti TaxID=2137479 RepID=A0A4Q1JZ50_9GAMM|nr:hypothetical protein [Pseudoxanthomonas composti]RXR06997.1 hypothetical protein EPA99_03410 [Pseudoxanthomonas composti]
MKITLVLFLLNIQSSYVQNIEREATAGVFDTVQFVSVEGKGWRIKTYAIDQDVHPWSIGSNTQEIVAVAKQNTRKHYGDVLSKTYVIETSDGIEGLRRELARQGLSATLEVAEAGFVFWVPAESDYRTRSTPAG